MQVQVYAILKDYFETEFAIPGTVGDIGELQARLVQENPAAAEILSVCRFAVHDRFINNDYKLQENDTVVILPPGSGG